MIYLRYLRLVLTHKWHVFLECLRVGMPLRGLMHDVSKFRLGEFIPYARYYCGSGSSDALDIAWFLHQKRNRHHWQWWLVSDGEALPMDEKSCLEMVCDWRAAGRDYGGSDAREYYLSKREKIILHPDTRALVEAKLGIR